MNFSGSQTLSHRPHPRSSGLGALPSNSTRRAEAEDGKKQYTLCFLDPLKRHPHHHILACGHCIVTDERESCGSNCGLGKNVRTTPLGPEFACPHSTCVASRNVLTRRDRRRDFDKKRTRACRKGYVAGLDSEVDRRRADAKLLQLQDQLARADFQELPERRRPVEYHRGRPRSASPDSIDEEYLRRGKDYKPNFTHLKGPPRLNYSERNLVDELNGGDSVAFHSYARGAWISPAKMARKEEDARKKAEGEKWSRAGNSLLQEMESSDPTYNEIKPYDRPYGEGKLFRQRMSGPRYSTAANMSRQWRERHEQNRRSMLLATRIRRCEAAAARRDGANTTMQDVDEADIEAKEIDYPDDPSDDADQSPAEEELHCVCRQTLCELDDRNVLQCVGNCGDWYHVDCVGEVETDLAEMKNNGIPWFCQGCRFAGYHEPGTLEGEDQEKYHQSHSSGKASALDRERKKLEAMEMDHSIFKTNLDLAGKQRRTLQRSFAPQSEPPPQFTGIQKLYCICQQLETYGVDMVECSGGCEGQWYHAECVEVSETEFALLKDSAVPWFCPDCCEDMEAELATEADRMDTE